MYLEKLSHVWRRTFSFMNIDNLSSLIEIIVWFFISEIEVDIFLILFIIAPFLSSRLWSGCYLIINKVYLTVQPPWRVIRIISDIWRLLRRHVLWGEEVFKRLSFLVDSKGIHYDKSISLNYLLIFLCWLDFEFEVNIVLLPISWYLLSCIWIEAISSTNTFLIVKLKVILQEFSSALISEGSTSLARTHVWAFSLRMEVETHLRNKIIWDISLIICVLAETK